MTDTLHEIPEVDPDLEATETIVEKPERDWDADARDMGWKPKDEWHGDPEGFRDAKEFVQRGDEIFGFIKRDRDRLAEKTLRVEVDRDDRLKRMEKQYIGILENQKKQHEAEIKTIEGDKLKAVEEGDTATYKALTQRGNALGAAPEVPTEQPVVDATLKDWSDDNAWFKTDPLARSVATATAGVVAQSGGDVHAQIKAAEKEVRKRFPEHFEPPRSTVETGGQPPRSKPKAKGVAQLPKEARDGFKECVRLGMYKEDQIAEYATSYWEQE